MNAPAAGDAQAGRDDGSARAAAEKPVEPALNVDARPAAALDSNARSDIDRENALPAKAAEPELHVDDRAAAARDSKARSDIESENALPAKAVEPVHYVDDARYARLWALLNEARTRSAAEDPGSDAVQRALFHEARLLDDRRYEEWLSLFAPECLYWVPSRSEPGDPRTETGIYLDDRRRLLDRVAMIRTGHLHAQIPPSRTRRMLTNIEQWAAPDGGVRARANVVIWEYRKGEMRPWPGWQVYEFLREPGGELALATKIVCLLDCDAPQGNYSFIL